MKKYNIQLRKDFNFVSLKSNKYHITCQPTKGYIYVTVRGPKLKKRGLSSVKADLTSFELKVVVLYFYKLARQHTNTGDKDKWIQYVNYAEIFGSCFD